MIDVCIDVDLIDSILIPSIHILLWCPNLFSLVPFAGMTPIKCAVLWIGTLTGGPVQGESPPVLVKESHIQTYSRTSVCGHTYLGVVYRKDRIY